MSVSGSPITCAIWGEPAVLEAGEVGDGAKVRSTRAGGRYGISGTAAAMIQQLTLQDRAKLTTWLVEQRRFGVALPIVNTETLEAVKKRRSLRYSERKDRFFRIAKLMGLGPGVTIPITAYVGNSADGFAHLQHIASWIEAISLEEAKGVIEMLAEEGLVRFASGRLSITAKGLDRMEELDGVGANTGQAFVAMWFGAEMNEPWRLGFAPAIRDAGYEPFRIDGKEHNNKIDDEIVAEIKRSRFLIADFTCGAELVKDRPVAVPRGGVYYEAGLAHGLGMEVIFSCRADRINDLHFDTRQFAHIVWNHPAELRVALYNRIAATVKEAPGAPGRGNGSVDPAPEPPKKPPVRLV